MEKEVKSRIEIFIHNNDVFFREDYSAGMMEEIVKEMNESYGVVFNKKCHSMCG